MTRAILTPPARAGYPSLAPRTAPSRPAAQREHLLRAVQRLAHRQEGGVLWIEGPAGVGKSHLLRYAAEEALRAGALAMTGGAVGAQAPSPLAELLAGPPREHDGAAEARPHRLTERAGDRLRDLTRAQPLVLVHDDLHAYDDRALASVRALTARTAGLPVLWLLAVRSHADAPAVEALRRDLPAERTVRLELAAWDTGSVRALVRDLLGTRAGEAEPYLPLTGGLPGAVRQLCALLGSEPGPGRGSAGSGPLARDLAAGRLDGLTREAQDLVLTASVLDAALGVRHLCKLLGRGEFDVLRPLREVLAAGLLLADQDRLAFAGPSVRDAVAATLPAPVRRAVRRRSVDLRLAEGTPPVTLAAEIADLAEPGDERALRVLQAAARELAPLSPADAAAHLRRALRLSRTDPPRRQRLAAELVPLLWETGELEEARALALEVLQAPPDAVAHARMCLELARVGGPFPGAAAGAHLRRALRHPGVPQSVKDQLLSTSLLHRLLAGEAEEAGGTVSDSLARARGTHPLSDLTRHTLRSMSACHRQRWTEALAHSEPVLAKVAELDPAYGPALPEAVLAVAWRAAVLGLTGADRAAADLVEGGLADAGLRGRPAYLPLWRTARARLLLDRGRPVEAAREAAAAWAGPHPPSLSAGNVAALACTRAAIALHSGDEAEVEACAALAEDFLAGDDPQEYRAGAWIALLMATCRGRVVAPELLPAAEAHLRRGFLHTTCAAPVDVALLVAAALGSGRREVADAAVEWSEERARLNTGRPLFAAAAAHTRGLFTGNADLLARAAEGYGAARPLWRARALEDAGRCARQGTGRPRLREALRLYEACGAVRDARRVRGAVGGTDTRRPAGTGTRAPAGASARTPAPVGAAVPAGDPPWRGLTPAELDVVRLIAHGSTNREAAERLFLSPHTVNTHLRHAFEKVGVRSRVQLARLYAQEVDAAGAPV